MRPEAPARSAARPHAAAVAAALVLALGGASVLRAEEPLDVDAAALARFAQPPLGLPPISAPPGNPPTAAKISLGRKLFLDRRLSSNGTLSCAMCHVPEQGFTVNESRTAVGIEGKTLRRNAPTLLNVGYVEQLFHDGREPSLDLQSLDVFTNPDEMGAPSLGALVARIESLGDYGGLFEAAFGQPPGIERIGRALGAYMRTLLSAGSPFDRWHYGGDADALSPPARHGYELFTGKAGCSSCHQLAESHALFTDRQFHDTGIGWYRSIGRERDRRGVRVALTSDRSATLTRATIASISEPPASDLGRYEVTTAPADRWLYRTPSLRNVGLTAPYMHDGSLLTLADVVSYYDRGGHRHEGLDSRIRPLALTATERAALVAFLESLTGSNVEELIRDARSERIGNPSQN